MRSITLPMLNDDMLSTPQRVPEDLETLANDFNGFSADDTGIAGSDDPGAEDTLTESFNTVSVLSRSNIG